MCIVIIITVLQAQRAFAPNYGMSVRQRTSTEDTRNNINSVKDEPTSTGAGIGTSAVKSKG